MRPLRLALWVAAPASWRPLECVAAAGRTQVELNSLLPPGCKWLGARTLRPVAIRFPFRLADFATASNAHFHLARAGPAPRSNSAGASVALALPCDACSRVEEFCAKNQ